MLKKDLRKKYSELRENLTDVTISSKSIAIANELLPLPIWSFDYYHLFLSIIKKKEIDTSFILSILQGKDKNTIIPKIKNAALLENYLLLDSTKLVINKLGVPEPTDGILVDSKKIDVVFVPLLAFDKKGNRIGYGKGYYDRFLSECRNDVIKIGLSFFEAEETIFDVSDNDIPMDYCVTPKGIYSFRDSSVE